MTDAARPVLSLFDRLIDDAPDMAVEEQEDDDAAFRRLKLGMRRDLEGLLNGKRPYQKWLGSRPGLADTVLGFGLADLSTEDFSSPAVRERLRRMIAQGIRTHEPRLRRVEVEVDGAPTSAGVRFRISAVMTLDMLEEAVIYDARLRPSDRAIDVNLAR